MFLNLYIFLLEFAKVLNKFVYQKDLSESRRKL